MSLSETIDLIKQVYTQSQIQANIFDFKRLSTIDAMQPKYFYRGEAGDYDSTFSSLWRFLEREKLTSQELRQLKYLQLSLYLFLREKIWKIPTVQASDHGDSSIEIAICGMLQHYGFDTSFLDVSGDLETAANFASMGKVGSIGRILVVNSHALNADSINYYFDLTSCKGLRPKSQASYVIWDQFRDLNLKSSIFLTKHNGKWFDFTLEKKDRSAFLNPSILTVKNDEVYHEITKWWNYSASTKEISSQKIIMLFKKKIEELKKYDV